mgnify:CR=1 FL=1
MDRAGSPAGDGGDEDDLGVVGEGRGPRGEFVVDGDAQAVGGEREGVAGAQIFVEAGGAGGGGREGFAGLGPLARHRAIYAALGELMTTDIHALSIKARTPGEAG